MERRVLICTSGNNKLQVKPFLRWLRPAKVSSAKTTNICSCHSVREQVFNWACCNWLTKFYVYITLNLSLQGISMNKHNPSIISNWFVTTACISLKVNTNSKHKYMSPTFRLSSRRGGQLPRTTMLLKPDSLQTQFSM